MILTKNHAEIYKTVKSSDRCMSVAEVSKIIGMERYQVADVFRKLLKKGAFIRLEKGQYKAVEVIKAKQPLPITARSNHLINTDIPDNIRELIIREAIKIPQPPRREIAALAGVRKLVVNQILIEEGLDRKDG